MNLFRDVHFIGFGACTPAGRTTMATAAVARSGLMRMRSRDDLLDSQRETIVVCSAAYLDEELVVEERTAELLVAALIEARSPLMHNEQLSDLSIPLFLGLPSPRPGLSPSYGARVRSAVLGLLGDSTGLESFNIVTGDHSAGLMALDEACQLVESGKRSLCFAGGADCYLNQETMTFLEEKGHLRTATNLAGFFPGEAASVCLVASKEVVESLLSFGRVLAISISQGEPLSVTLAAARALEERQRAEHGDDEANEEQDGEVNDVVVDGPDELGAGDIDDDETLIGEVEVPYIDRFKNELSDVWEELLSDQPEEMALDSVITDINGQKSRAFELSGAFMVIGERFPRESAYLSPTLFWGDVGAASCPLFTSVAAANAFQRGSPSERCLITTTSEDGMRGAALVELGVGEE